MKRAAGVWALVLMVGWMLGGVALADSPRQPQQPDPNRPGRLVGHPPWVNAAPAPRAAPSVRQAPARRVAETPVPKKHHATKKEPRPERGKASDAPAGRPATAGWIDFPVAQEEFDAVRAGVLGLASAAGLAVVVMVAIASLRRRAPA